MEHDASYKLLFAHARMVEDLLRGFVHEPWVQELDWTTLERVSDSQLSDDLRSRHDDLVWRIRWGPDWLRAPDDDSLRRAFTMWLRRVLLPARLPGVTLPEVHNLVEMHAMLAERVVEWTQQWKEEGQQQEAQAMVLEAVATHFGETPADIVARVHALTDREALHRLLRQAILCPSLEAFRDVFHSQA